MVICIKNIFKICFVIIGTIIGAGFASGKEIYSFFCIYGIYGLYGIIFADIFIGVIIYICLNNILKNNIYSYSDFTGYLVGSNKIISNSLNNVMNIFLLTSFIVMVSGFSSFLKQEFNIPNVIGSLLICILAIFTFYKNINGIVKINLFLIPILIILIFFLGIKNNILSFSFNLLPQQFNLKWLTKSILYASYNSVPLIPIIINLIPLIKDKKQIKIITLFTTIFLLMMSTIIFIVLSMRISAIEKLDIPLIFIASSSGIFYKYIYSFTILIAIFTTAISAGYSFLNNISKTKKDYFIFSFIICLISVLCCNIGFSALVNLLYPILGFLGLFEIVLLFLKNR